MTQIWGIKKMWLEGYFIPFNSFKSFPLPLKKKTPKQNSLNLSSPFRSTPLDFPCSNIALELRPNKNIKNGRKIPFHLSP